jgi:hypothetical protein
MDESKLTIAELIELIDGILVHATHTCDVLRARELLAILKRKLEGESKCLLLLARL